MTADLRNRLDRGRDYGEHDTVTREEWRRARGVCVECGQPLKPRQLSNGGRFCCHRCAGRNTARREYGPEVVPLHPKTEDEEGTVGIVHDLVGAEFDAVTGERNDYPLPPLCEGCGHPYRRKRADQRFCSRGCSARWHNTHRPPGERKKKVKRLPVPAVAAAAATPGFSAEQQSAMIDAGLRNLVIQAVAAADEWRFEATIGGVALTLSSPPR